MSKCNTIQNILADYRTGMLSDRQCEELESHISECADCARELALLDSVLTMVEDNTPELEPPAGLWNGVYNGITDPATRQVGFLDNLRHWISAPVHAAGVGVATLAIAAGLFFAAPANHPIEPSRVGPADEYIQGHAAYAGQASVADQAAYLTLVAASSKTSVTN